MTEDEIAMNNLLASIFHDRERINVTKENSPRAHLRGQIMDWPEMPNSLIAQICECTPEEVEAMRVRIHQNDRVMGVNRSRSRKRAKLLKQRDKAAKKAKIPSDLRWAVWERDDFTCKHCGRRDHLSIDHIIPESRGGETTLENLWTLCKPCNSAKGTKVFAYPTEVTLSG